MNDQTELGWLERLDRESDARRHGADLEMDVLVALFVDCRAVGDADAMGFDFDLLTSAVVDPKGLRSLDDRVAAKTQNCFISHLSLHGYVH